MTDLELVLDIDRPAVASRFFRAGASLLELLDEVSGVPIDWQLTHLQLGSSVARISAPPDVADADVHLRSVASGLLAASAGRAPDGWDPDALSAARRLAEVDADAGAARLALREDDRIAEVIDLGPVLAARLADLQPSERTMPGAVRGQLVGVSIARGNRASLRSSWGRVVKVTFPNDLRVALGAALYDDVELTGQVRQDSVGEVFHISANTIRVLDEPPIKWADLFGIEPEIAGGLTIAEYLESARGEA